MELPIYCVVDSRPVKVIATADGDLEVLVFDPRSGEFQRRMDLLSRVMLQDEDVLELTEEEFDSHLARLDPRRSAG